MNVIREAAQFVKRTRRKLIKGAMSSEPLTVLRMEWRGDFVECDWLIRPMDSDGRKMPLGQALQRQTEQAFHDALDLRDLVFDSFPAVMRAQLRMYRADRNHSLELMMSGMVNRLDPMLHKFMSAAIRARLIGFEFVLADGVLSVPLTNKINDVEQKCS